MIRWQHPANICCKAQNLHKKQLTVSKRKLGSLLSKRCNFYRSNNCLGDQLLLLFSNYTQRCRLQSFTTCSDVALTHTRTLFNNSLRDKFLNGPYLSRLSTICDRTVRFSASNPLYMKFLDSLEEEFERLSNSMENVGYKKTQNSGRSQHELARIVDVVNQLKNVLTEIEELKSLITDLSAGDTSLRSIADNDILQCREKIVEIEKQLIELLIVEEKSDQNDIIMEVTAGVGGQEAMLFAEEIFHMYQNYADYKGLNSNIISYDRAEGALQQPGSYRVDGRFMSGGSMSTCRETLNSDKHLPALQRHNSRLTTHCIAVLCIAQHRQAGGVRQASAEISGDNVYKYFKFEAGVHRVQRVPKTEKSGRIHTSTITVSVLPQATEIDIQLNPNDLQIDTFRSSGPGGQSVNKTNSAIRITHKPTGMVVECQTDRSQVNNKRIAMNVLRTRLYQKELDKQESSRRTKRKLQIGSAGRSEKNRTYNYNQDRITEHRIGETLYNLPAFLKGGEELDDLIEKLLEEERLESLDIMLDEFEAAIKQQVKPLKA